MDHPRDFLISRFEASGKSHIITVVPFQRHLHEREEIFIFPNREFNDRDKDRIISIGIIPKQNVLRILTAEYLITIAEDMISIESVRPDPYEYKDLQSSIQVDYNNSGILDVARSLMGNSSNENPTVKEFTDEEENPRYEIVSGCRSLNIPYTLPQGALDFADQDFGNMPIEQLLNKCKELVALLGIKVTFAMPNVSGKTEGN